MPIPSLVETRCRIRPLLWISQIDTQTHTGDHNVVRASVETYELELNLLASVNDQQALRFELNKFVVKLYS